MQGGLEKRKKQEKQAKEGMRKDWPGEGLNNRASKAIFIPRDNNKLLNYNGLIELIMASIRQQWDSMDLKHPIQPIMEFNPSQDTQFTI